MRRSLVTTVLYPGAGAPACVGRRTVCPDTAGPNPACGRRAAHQRRPTSRKSRAWRLPALRRLPVSDQAGSDGGVRRTDCQGEGLRSRRATTPNASSSSRRGRCIRPRADGQQRAVRVRRRPGRAGRRVRPADAVRRRPRPGSWHAREPGNVQEVHRRVRRRRQPPEPDARRRNVKRRTKQKERRRRRKEERRGPSSFRQNFRFNPA